MVSASRCRGCQSSVCTKSVAFQREQSTAETTMEHSKLSRLNGKNGVSGLSGCSGRSASEAEPFRIGWEYQHPSRYTLTGRKAWSWVRRGRRSDRRAGFNRRSAPAVRRHLSNERSKQLSDMTKPSNVMRWTRWARCLRRTTSTLAKLNRVAVKRAFEGASKCRLYQWS
jgi:hypothetical protein